MNINDLGLPQGLPEMSGTGSPMSVGGSACFCTGKCRELGYCPNQSVPQLQAMLDRALRESVTVVARSVDVPAREMTAADLGIQYSGNPAQLKSDAPYSFWLGADHG
jgi:hypothetical protein